MTRRITENGNKENRRLKYELEFIKKAQEIHTDKDGIPLDDYSKVKYVKASQPVIIICKKHGEYEQSPSSHITNHKNKDGTIGHRCKKCAVEKTSLSQTMTQKEFIQRCEEKHPNLLDYSKTVYIKWKTPCIFICKKCYKEFSRDPGHMLGGGRGHGCNVCNGGVKDDLSTFIAKAKETHGDKYKYHLFEYTNSLTKVKIS